MNDAQANDNAHLPSETVCVGGAPVCDRLWARARVAEESAGWTTHARSGFPLPFGRGEGQGEGSREKPLTGRAFPLTPALSPSAGERENRRPSRGLVVYPTNSSASWPQTGAPIAKD